MSEGYTVEDHRGSVAGIGVRQNGERGFRFFSSTSAFEAMDGHVFVSAEAAQRAAHGFARTCTPLNRYVTRTEGVAA